MTLERAIDWVERISVTKFGGNSVQDYLIALIVLVLGVLLTRAARFILSKVLPRLANLTETDLDDKIADQAVGPLSAMTLLPFLHISVGLLRMPDALRRLLGNGLTIAANVLVALLLLRVVDVFFREGMPRWRKGDRRGVTSQALEYGRKFTKIIVVAGVSVGVLKSLGFDIFSLITGLGIGGLAVALAAQETLGNVLGSLQIMTDRPYDVGDVIRVGGHTGRVHTVGLRSTKLLSPTGVQVVIPNKRLAESPIENMSAFNGLTMELDVGLTYDASAAQLREAIEALTQAVRGVNGVHDDVHVYFQSFGDFSLNLHVIYFIPDLSQRLAVSSEVNLRIRGLISDMGLEFAFPTRTVHLQREDTSEGDEAAG